MQPIEDDFGDATGLRLHGEKGVHIAGGFNEDDLAPAQQDGCRDILRDIFLILLLLDEILDELVLRLGVEDFAVTGVQTCALPIFFEFGGGPVLDIGIVVPFARPASTFALILNALSHHGKSLFDISDDLDQRRAMIALLRQTAQEIGIGLSRLGFCFPIEIDHVRERRRGLLIVRHAEYLIELGRELDFQSPPPFAWVVADGPRWIEIELAARADDRNPYVFGGVLTVVLVATIGAVRWQSLLRGPRRPNPDDVRLFPEDDRKILIGLSEALEHRSGVEWRRSCRWSDEVQRVVYGRIMFLDKFAAFSHAEPQPKRSPSKELTVHSPDQCGGIVERRLRALPSKPLLVELGPNHKRARRAQTGCQCPPLVRQRFCDRLRNHCHRAGFYLVNVEITAHGIRRTALPRPYVHSPSLRNGRVGKSNAEPANPRTVVEMGAVSKLQRVPEEIGRHASTVIEDADAL